MKRHILMIGSALFLFAISAFGQASPDCSRPESLSSDESQKCKEAAARMGRAIAGTRFTEPSLDLLPSADDAWIVHLVTTGGFSGRGMPTITVRSDGFYACGEAEPLEFVSLPLAKLGDLDDAITTANLKIEKGIKSSKEPPAFACSDCFATTIVLGRRDRDKKKRSYISSDNLSKYPPIAERFNRIQHGIETLGVCRN